MFSSYSGYIQYEVSPWWSPYVYVTKVHSEEWMLWSASADLFREIWSQPDFHWDSLNDDNKSDVDEDDILSKDNDDEDKDIRREEMRQEHLENVPEGKDPS
ncbi:hypothetical protein EDD15DRAFT_2199614 [Pisolithus albus]|nr:hypothetical protein EDD15DRAFT_2199614 [Pisolithus albus]